MSLRLVNWNVEWVQPLSNKAEEIRKRTAKHDPDIVCLTETYDTMLSRTGHLITSQDYYGYPIIESRRKVALWSKHPWQQTDDLGQPDMPPGRFISAITQTSLGEVAVIGVCIPWQSSRVGRTSPEKRMMWEDHRKYLHALARLLSKKPAKRLILVGDFNQRMIRRTNTPIVLRSALREAIPSGVTVATSTLGYQGRRTIDHIALSDDLVVESLGVISNIDGRRKLSDHFGVFAYLSAQDTQVSASQR